MFNVQIDQTKSLIRELLNHHNLNNWKIGWSKAFPKGAAYTDFIQKTIRFNVYYILANSKKEIIDTVLHEIAHALVGRKHKHGNVWKAKYIEIGGSGKEYMTYSSTGKTLAFYAFNRDKVRGKVNE